METTTSQSVFGDQGNALHQVQWPSRNAADGRRTINLVAVWDVEDNPGARIIGAATVDAQTREPITVSRVGLSAEAAVALTVVLGMFDNPKQDSDRAAHVRELAPIDRREVHPEINHYVAEDLLGKLFESA
jgi:hypothetical protein